MSSVPRSLTHASIQPPSDRSTVLSSTNNDEHSEQSPLLSKRTNPPTTSHPSHHSHSSHQLKHSHTVPHRSSPSLMHNLILTTAPLTQVGLFVLLFVVWSSVFLRNGENGKKSHISQNPIFFDAHPMLNVLGVVALVEAVLVLQPTGREDPVTKNRAAKWHAHLMGSAATAFLAAGVVVVVHKIRNGIPHMETTHGKFGVATYSLLLMQALVGISQRYFPIVYGGMDNARACFRYHRMFGYIVILPMLLITAILATKTEYAEKVLGLMTWAVGAASLAVVGGLYTRIRIAKWKSQQQ